MTDPIDFLTTLVQFRSLNPVNPANLPVCEEVLAFLDAKARETGAIMVQPLNFAGLHPEFPAEVANRVYRWKKGNATRSLCFSGHIDTVSVVDAEWTKAGAFSGEIINGYIYGRGTTDMKAGVAAFFMTMQRLMEDDSFIDFDIYAAITSDEEVMALNGSKPTFEWMANNGHVPDAVLVGEPASMDELADTIITSSRGVLAGLGIVKGVGGHSGNPANYVNPMPIFARLTTALYGILFEPHPDSAWPEITRFEMTAGKTSTNIPNINMVPDTFTFNWSIRFTPNYTPQQLADMLQQAIKDAGLDDSVELIARVDLHAMVYETKRGGRLANSLSAAAYKLFGRVPNAVRGIWASDGRFAHLFFKKNGVPVEVIEAGTPRTGGVNPADPDYLLEGGMHQLHERVKISHYFGCINWYEATLRNFFAE